jgi:hypothetical protein
LDHFLSASIKFLILFTLSSRKFGAPTLLPAPAVASDVIYGDAIGHKSSLATSLAQVHKFPVAGRDTNALIVREGPYA